MGASPYTATGAGIGRGTALATAVDVVVAFAGVRSEEDAGPGSPAGASRSLPVPGRDGGWCGGRPVRFTWVALPPVRSGRGPAQPLGQWQE